MANHKSAIKAHQRSLKRRASNIGVKSEIGTFTKKVERCVANQDLSGSVLALRVAMSKIMKSVSSGVFKKRTASRRVANLAKKVALLEGAKTTA